MIEPKIGEVWTADHWNHARYHRVTGVVVQVFPSHADLDIGKVDFHHFPGNGVARIETRRHLNWKKAGPLESLAVAARSEQ